MGARAIRKLKDIAGTVAARAIFSAALWDGVAAIYPGTPVGKRSSSSEANDLGQVHGAPAAHSEGTGCSAPHVWEKGVVTHRGGLLVVTYSRAAVLSNARLLVGGLNRSACGRPSCTAENAERTMSEICFHLTQGRDSGISSALETSMMPGRSWAAPRSTGLAV